MEPEITNLKSFLTIYSTASANYNFKKYFLNIYLNLNLLKLLVNIF